jgi:hypothetical protein
MLLLLDRSRSEEHLMPDQWTAESLLVAFDEHLRRRRGLCAGARRNYVRHVRSFLAVVSIGDGMDPSGICVADVVSHVGELARRYRPGTVELAASALRSFFRFLRVEGLRTDRLECWAPLAVRMSASRWVRLSGNADGLAPGCGARPWWSRWRRGVWGVVVVGVDYSAVTSATAARAADSSTMVLFAA